MKHLPPLVKLTALAGMAVALSCTSSLSAALVFSEDFESGLGSFIHTTTGTDYEADISPTSPFATASLRTRDNSGTLAPSIEWEFASAVSAVQISFDYHIADISGGTTTGQIVFGVGAKTGSTGKDLNSSANRLATLVFFNDNRANYAAQGNVNRLLSDPLALDTIAKMTIVINDFDNQPISYTDPNGTLQSLASNTAVFYQDNNLKLTTAFTGTIAGNDLATTEGNIGRIGFNGLGGPTGIEAHFDNVTVTAVPEPRTYALLFGSLVLGLVMIRRRLR